MRFLKVAGAGLLCLAVVLGRIPSVHAQAEREPAAARHADEPHATAGHGEGGHGEGAAHGKADPLTADPDLAIATFIIFMVLLAVLWKFAWGPISKSLDEREEAIARFMADAKRHHEDAKLHVAEYERKLAGAADEVRALVEEARRDAEHTKQEILAEARAGADAERVRAIREIEAATDGAIKQLAERSADLAVDLAGKIVSAKLSAGDHATLIREAITKFPKTSPSRN